MASASSPRPGACSPVRSTTQETLAAVARLAVPSIADWCAVDVLAGAEVKRVATAHADPRKVAEVLEIAERYPPDPASPTGIHAIMRSGRSELYAEITEEMLEGAARDDAHLALLRSIGMTSAMVVPMLAARHRDRRDHVRERRDRPRVRRRRPRRSPRASPRARRPRSRTRGSTPRAPRSRARCRRRCCRPRCPTCRASSSPRSTTRRARARRSAATSTTSSTPPRTSGTRSSATSAARAPRRRR